MSTFSNMNYSDCTEVQQKIFRITTPVVVDVAVRQWRNGLSRYHQTQKETLFRKSWWREIDIDTISVNNEPTKICSITWNRRYYPNILGYAPKNQHSELLKKLQRVSLSQMFSDTSYQLCLEPPPPIIQLLQECPDLCICFISATIMSIGK